MRDWPVRQTPRVFAIDFDGFIFCVPRSRQLDGHVLDVSSAKYGATRLRRDEIRQRLVVPSTENVPAALAAEIGTGDYTAIKKVPCSTPVSTCFGDVPCPVGCLFRVDRGPDPPGPESAAAT